MAWEEVTPVTDLDERVLRAYFAFSQEQVRAGILDHRFVIYLLAGETETGAMIHVLRDEGRLPEGYE